jgi:hypothetical protein
MTKFYKKKQMTKTRKSLRNNTPKAGRVFLLQDQFSMSSPIKFQKY